MSAIRDAATVIVARDAPAGLEVFLVRRNARGHWGNLVVFPGGVVEADDRSSDARERALGWTHDDAAYAFAAARETFEEAGLLFSDRALPHDALARARDAARNGMAFAAVLYALDVRVDLHALVPFSRWVTPAVEARRFDARFFVARAPASQRAEADAAEVHDGRWLRPSDALAEQRAGRLNVMFPTIKHLARIAPFPDVDALLRYASMKAIVPVSPEATRGDDGELVFSLGELEDAW